MQEIKFYPRNDFIKGIIDPPKPTQIPDWFKKIPIYFDPNSPTFTPGSDLDIRNGEINTTAKTCIPFMETLSSGYTVNLWCDIQIKIDKNRGGKSIHWATTEQDLAPVFTRPDSGVPTYEGFDSTNFVWASNWGVKTPKGYSCLFTHPLNRTDLPFQTVSGIIDTDQWGIWGAQPFALLSNWEGIIPAGTPIIQIIPFKRDDWKSTIDESLTEWATKENFKSRSKFRGYYKKHYWSKKTFE